MGLKNYLTSSRNRDASDLCSRSGALAESQGGSHAARITNSGVSEQEIAAITVYLWDI
jgi:hypothetical protein